MKRDVVQASIVFITPVITNTMADQGDKSFDKALIVGVPFIYDSTSESACQPFFSILRRRHVLWSHWLGTFGYCLCYDLIGRIIFPQKVNCLYLDWNASCFSANLLDVFFILVLSTKVCNLAQQAPFYSWRKERATWLRPGVHYSCHSLT